MTNEEKILVDALVNMSKSIGRIADDIGEIKSMMSLNHRNQLRENRRSRQTAGTVITEGRTVVKGDGGNRGPSREAMLGRIRDIRGGKYI